MSLQELVLIRHAQAAPAVGWEADASRRLTPRGLEEAGAAGRWLQDTVGMPQGVLCSPAMRTRETLAQLVAAGCTLPEADIAADIHEASLGDLLGVIEAHIAAMPALARLWLVGHNPGLEQLVFHLDAAARLHALPTAGIVVMQFDGRVPVTDPGAARIAHTWSP